MMPIKAIILIMFILLNFFTFSEIIKISDDLIVKRVSENSYIHTQKKNNGLIYINNGEAIIISTPDSLIETENLINWAKNVKKVKIVAYIIDRWHPDAMGGISVVHKHNILTYANEMTIKIAKEKGLATPKVGFNNKKFIKVGNNKIVCHYFGQAHTKDGIVVWIPQDKILFGGNGVRNYKGWVGNIADANLKQWSNTTKNIKKEYRNVKIVVPGHGKYGGLELLDYTINLYEVCKFKKEKSSIFAKNNYLNIYTNKELSLLKEETNKITDKTIILEDSSKKVVIISPEIIYKKHTKRIISKFGRVKIYDKNGEYYILKSDVNYNELISYKYNNSVGYVVILKSIENI